MKKMNVGKYSSEKSVRIIMSLMKAHGITRVIVSPGSTNVCLVNSLQHDKDFKLYSSVDERSAAYMACGMVSETNEPVALSCTEATASRNYLPALTEAYYRKLPILIISATNEITFVGQNHPQMIDRSVLPKDVCRKSLFVPYLNGDCKKENGYINLINDTMLELTRYGGGPVHIEYETRYSDDYSVEELPVVNVTRRITSAMSFPLIGKGSIGIYIGAHKRWNKQELNKLDAFCMKHNAVVLKDHLSNYHGKFGVDYTIVVQQLKNDYACTHFDTMIYIGDVSSAYRKKLHAKKVWRVNPDGELRDVMQQYGGQLEYVFQMTENEFFEYYAKCESDKATTHLIEEWQELTTRLHSKIGELPFSNLWVASELSGKLPSQCRLYLGIENSMRSWNYFATDDSIDCYCNTGGYGIDGGISSLLGASFVSQNALFYGITGDLAFFYDMNSLGNRHVGKNIRLLIINNGLGQQFRNPGYAIDSVGEDVDMYIAARGHYGKKSVNLVKNYAEALGFEYFSASNKDEFKRYVNKFCSPCIEGNSIIFEVFTDTAAESAALNHMTHLEVSLENKIKRFVKSLIKT